MRSHCAEAYPFLRSASMHSLGSRVPNSAKVERIRVLSPPCRAAEPGVPNSASSTVAAQVGLRESGKGKGMLRCEGTNRLRQLRSVPVSARSAETVPAPGAPAGVPVSARGTNSGARGAYLFLRQYPASGIGSMGHSLLDGVPVSAELWVDCLQRRAKRQRRKALGPTRSDREALKRGQRLRVWCRA